ncbi:MAG: hypothetical protein WCO68_10210, partial [Verrucomicrobiota bacterium]
APPRIKSSAKFNDEICGLAPQWQGLRMLFSWQSDVFRLEDSLWGLGDTPLKMECSQWVELRMRSGSEGAQERLIKAVAAFAWEAR